MACKVGSERIDETADPELTIERALKTYLKKGYSKEWIDQRLKTIEVRKELTDEWDNRGVHKGIEYACRSFNKRNIKEKATGNVR